MRLRYLKYFLVVGLLSLLPAQLWAQSAQTSLGLNYLAQSQNPNGSWGGTATSITDVFPSTSTAVDALKLIKTTPSTNRTNAIGYLSAQTLNVTDYLSRRIVSLTGTGANTSADLTALLALQNFDGGWGPSSGYGSNILDTTLALRAISGGNGSASVSNQATGYILPAQNSDGGWGFRVGDNSDVYMTSLVMQTLEVQARTTTLANILSRAAMFLLSHQNADGGIGSGSSTSWETAMVFKAIVTQTGDMTSRLAALNYLLSQQLADGSWNDDPYSTALALQALAIGAPLQTPPATLVSLVNLLNGSLPATTFGPQQTVTVNVSLNGPPAQLEITVLDSNGQVIFTQTGTGPFTFDTGTLPPGTYTIITWVLDPATGVPVSQSQTTFTIAGGVGVSGGVLAVIPRYTHAGAIENVILAASLYNGSNIPGSLSIIYQMTTPSGAIVTNGSITVPVGPDLPTSDATLATFSYTFTESGDYPVQAQIYNGPTLLTTFTSAVSVAPLVRIDPGVTVTPGTVLPDGDKRIHIDIHLEGVEQTP